MTTTQFSPEQTKALQFMRQLESTFRHAANGTRPGGVKPEVFAYLKEQQEARAIEQQKLDTVSAAQQPIRSDDSVGSVLAKTA